MKKIKCPLCKKNVPSDFITDDFIQVVLKNGHIESLPVTHSACCSQLYFDFNRRLDGLIGPYTISSVVVEFSNGIPVKYS